ncbi:MAG TPA: GNAT family N-acetyltransferase [Thermomicrobiales bacterium]|nr:GNAT family N-acetyltransferase [Thermomicrobiales bacterium]
MGGHEPVGIFYGWWRGDELPDITPPAGLLIERLDDPPSSPTLDSAEAATLRAEGHRLYVARIDTAITGHGWAATRTASIGEVGARMQLARNERYLWGFVTSPEWRGQNIYPALIQAILRREADADRFWIGHDADNHPSARGVLKAGFTPVGAAYVGDDGVLHYARYGEDERERAAQALLGMPP